MVNIKNNACQIKKNTKIEQKEQRQGVCSECAYMYDPHELDVVHFLPFMCHCSHPDADRTRSYFLNHKCEIGHFVSKKENE